MAQFPSTTSAYGVWTLQDVRDAVRGNNWPTLYVPLPDPDFEYVVLLLNGDGPDGGQNNTYTDSSVNNLTLSATSDITQGSFNPFGDNWSNYLDGTVEHLQLPVNLTLSFGAADFTIEGWMNVASIDGTYRCFYSVGPTVQIYSRSGTIECYFNDTDNTSGYIVVNLQGPASSITANTWHYFTVVRNGTTFTAYVDGVAGTPITGVTAAVGTSARGAIVGDIQSAGGTLQYPFTGYISNLRIVKGTALYTSAFTPPTEPLTAIAGTSLLTCQSYGFKDASTNDFTITVNGTPEVTPFSPFSPTASYDASSLGGSAYFPNTTTVSTGHQFSTPATADLDIGSGDFTIECFYYPTSIQNYSRVLWFNETWSNINAAGLAYGSPTGGKLTFVANGIANPMVSTDNDMELFCWYHIAVTRTGNEFAMYVDGVRQTSTYTSSSEIFPTSTPILYVGNGPTSVGGYSPLQGYVANARVVKGTAVYSTDFTPPTAPVTAVSGTAALIDFADAAIPDYSTINNVNTVGNADISTAVVKYGTGSLAFDGTGDYLSTPSTPVFGTGDFTIEFWVYFNEVNNSTVKYLYDFRNASATSASFLAQEASNSWTYLNGAGAGISTGWNSGTFTADTWYHVAISRSSGTTKFFVDGTETSSVADTSNYANETFILVSRYTAANFLNGYIDDLRITKGLARYTANFTPPTEALPTF